MKKIVSVIALISLTLTSCSQIKVVIADKINSKAITLGGITRETWPTSGNGDSISFATRYFVNNNFQSIATADNRYPLLSFGYTNPSWITSLAWGKISGAPTIPAPFNAIQGSNMSITGTYPNLTFSSIASGGGGAAWYSYVNVQTYGAIPNDGLDDYAAIQSAVNYAIANNIRRVVLPKGAYLSSNTIQIIAGGSVTPTAGYVSLDITGESNFWNTGGQSTSSITLTVKDRPLIAIQRGEGCHITNLSLIGAFRARNPNTDRFAFFNTTASNFVNDGSRDNPFSPSCGVAIDPYWPTNDSTWKGAGNWFPSLGKYYGLGTGTGGTGNVIENCQIDGFVIGVANSLNVEMLNAELTILRKISFGNGNYYGLKWCVVGTQAQEKVNIIKECSSWGAAYGFFSNHSGYNGTIGYGRTGEGNFESGNWNIEDINGAGASVVFCDIVSQGYFPCFINRVYYESIGKLGTYSVKGGSFSNSLFDFEYHNSAGTLDLLTSTAGNFKACTFRYYGGTEIMVMRNISGAVFEDCNFSGAPYYDESSALRPVFKNTFNREFVNNTQKNITLRLNRGEDNISVDNRIQLASFNNVTESVSDIGGQSTTLFYGLSNPAAVITLTGRSFVYTATNPSSFYVGGIVRLTQGAVIGFGKVTSIVADTVIVNYASPNILTGTSTLLEQIYKNEWVGSFFGDFQTTNKITNLKLDWGFSLSDFVGRLFRNPNFYFNQYFKITSYDATLNEFTIATSGSQAVAANVVGIHFTNETRKSYLVNDNREPGNAYQMVLQRNSLWKIFPNSSNERVFKITKTGLNLATAPVQAAVTTATTGGSLAAATYYYVVTAITPNNETVKSNEQSVATTGTTSSNTVSWAAVTGATGYRIYRGTAAGAENVYYSVGAVTSYVDINAASTAGTPEARAATWVEQ